MTVKALESIGMKNKEDFVAVGRPAAGAQCIEGLVPKSIVAKVYGAEVGIVQALQSAKAEERKSARNKLKTRLLDQVVADRPPEEELADFKKLFLSISKALKQ